MPRSDGVGRTQRARFDSPAGRRTLDGSTPAPSGHSSLGRKLYRISQRFSAAAFHSVTSAIRRFCMPGSGSIPTQFYGFRIPVAENRARFDEALDIIRQAWSGERFSYTGQFYQVDNLAVAPKPLQQPHPPVRVAVHTAESFAHIGDLGLPIYSGTTTTPRPA